MAKQRVITLHYDEAQSHSFRTGVSSAYAVLGREVEALFHRPLSHFLILVSSSRKVISSPADIESALRDTFAPELSLDIAKKPVGSIPTQPRSAQTSLHLSQTLEVTNDTDFAAITTEVVNYTRDPSFLRLVLSRDQLNAGEAHTVARLIAEGKSLREVGLAECKWGDEAWATVLNAVASRSTLKTLRLESLFRVKPEALRTTVSALAGLEALGIGEISLSAAELTAVVAALEGKSAFRHFALRQVPLFHCQPLAQTLPALSSLEVLECVDCSIESSDVTTLLAALQSLSLTQLNLSHNRLSSESCPAFSAFIAEHSSLTVLTLCGNWISEDGAQELLAALERASRPIQIALAGNRISRDSVQSLTRSSNGALLFTDATQTDTEALLESRCSCKCVLI